MTDSWSIGREKYMYWTFPFPKVKKIAVKITAAVHMFRVMETSLVDGLYGVF